MSSIATLKTSLLVISLTIAGFFLLSQALAQNINLSSGEPTTNINNVITQADCQKIGGKWNECPISETAGAQHALCLESKEYQRGKKQCPTPACEPSVCQIIDQTGKVLGITEPLAEAEAGEDRKILINSEVKFNAVGSQIPVNLKEKIRYIWNFGDGAATAEGEEVTHIYKNSGEYTVALNIKTENTLPFYNKLQDELKVKVMKEAVFLILGESVAAQDVEEFNKSTERLDFLIYQLPFKEEGQEFIQENALTSELLERISEIKKSKLIIVWMPKSIVGVNALSMFGQEVKNIEDIAHKGVVIVSEGNLAILSRLAQPIFNILSPKYVVLIPKNVLDQIIDATANGDNVISRVQASGDNYRILGIHSKRELDKITPFNFFSYFINLMINRGVPINTVLLILMLPLVASLISFSRQIIGLKAFGVYIPSILAITLVVTGLKSGIIVLIAILLVGTLIRLGLKKLRLLYLPRMAIVLTIVSLSILILFLGSTYFIQAPLTTVSIFPILILIALVEEFVKVQMEEGSRTAIIIIVETLILAIIGFYLVNWQSLRNIVLSYPEIILLSLIFNFFIGKWTGLRLLEYYRFRKVIEAIRWERGENNQTSLEKK